jgi:hypothetical protein
VALVLAILLLLILTVIGIALMFTTSIENILAGTETKISKIFYAADSGIEYAGAMLSTTGSYTGGALPVNVSSHYASIATPDMQVTVNPPILIGYSIQPGDEMQSSGHQYGSSQVVENIYAVSSGASSTVIQASKAIDAEVGVYPKQLSIPK